MPDYIVLLSHVVCMNTLKKICQAIFPLALTAYSNKRIIVVDMVMLLVRALHLLPRYKNEMSSYKIRTVINLLIQMKASKLVTASILNWLKTITLTNQVRHVLLLIKQMTLKKYAEKVYKFQVKTAVFQHHLCYPQTKIIISMLLKQATAHL